MQYVELGDLAVAKSLLLDRTGAVELITADGGPLMAYKDFGPVRRYFLGFSPLLESNWWRQPSLVIFLRNVMEEICPSPTARRLKINLQPPSGAPD